MTSPRPQWNHPDVKTKAVETVFPDIKAWAYSMGVVGDNVPDNELRAAVTIAVFESADSYEAARYLEDFYDWPSNGELASLIGRAFLLMPRLTTPAVHEWVMKNRIRFPASEGQDVRFRVGDAELSGTVVGVVRREARGFVELTGMKKGQVLPVAAEDVVKVYKTKQPGGRPTPPTGGTPVAMKGGAVLKEAKAA